MCVHPFLCSLRFFSLFSSLKWLMFDTTHVFITDSGVTKVSHMKASPYYAVRQTYPPEWVQNRQHAIGWPLRMSLAAALGAAVRICN